MSAEKNVSTPATVRNKCYYVKNQFLAQASVKLLISICVLCLEGLSSTLWAFWVFDVGEGRIVLVTVALKCISNVSLGRRLPGESLEVRTRTPQLVFFPMWRLGQIHNKNTSAAGLDSNLLPKLIKYTPQPCPRATSPLIHSPLVRFYKSLFEYQLCLASSVLKPTIRNISYDL